MPLNSFVYKVPFFFLFISITEACVESGGGDASDWTRGSSLGIYLVLLCRNHGSKMNTKIRKSTKDICFSGDCRSYFKITMIQLKPGNLLSATLY